MTPCDGSCHGTCPDAREAKREALHDAIGRDEDERRERYGRARERAVQRQRAPARRPVVQAAMRRGRARGR